MRGFGPPAIANPPYCVPSSMFYILKRLCFFIWNFKWKKGWREFSKTSRPSICDLRFEEILNKIRPEKIINERGATGTTITTSNFTNNGTVDGNGKDLGTEFLTFQTNDFITKHIKSALKVFSLIVW